MWTKHLLYPLNIKWGHNWFMNIPLTKRHEPTGARVLGLDCVPSVHAHLVAGIVHHGVAVVFLVVYGTVIAFIEVGYLVLSNIVPLYGHIFVSVLPLSCVEGDSSMKKFVYNSASFKTATVGT